MVCGRFYNKSKAKSLDLLKVEGLIFVIPKFISFKCKIDTDSIYDKVINNFNKKLLIIRSSASDEDCYNNSSAGEYESVLNISSDNAEKIIEAVNKVVSSYKKKRPLLPEDEVIIQEMVQNTTMSGVIFTHDLNTGAPYYVINYDDQSGLTDTVTSGDGKYANRTLYVHRNSINKLRSERFTKLLQAVQELEQVMESRFLDIEFALGKDLTPYLLQVRAITTQPNWNRAVTKRVDVSLQGVQAFVAERFKRLNSIYGETTLLGQMPDWNPVEMIGRSPRSLATSLYQTLITDRAWSDARENMGYAVPTGQPLMVTLAGQPFIDTRLSFHSYLPNTISPIIAEKVVNYWLDHLKASPELHDKVEFEVAITTYSFDIDDKIKQLIGDALTDSEKEEFKQAHLKQTRELVKGEGPGSLKKALDKIKILNARQSKQNNSELSPDISSLFTMVSDCIRYGTIPFSILARHGFIAKTILLSLHHLGIITKDEINQFQMNIQTVASDLVDDMRSLQLGKLTNTEFMSLYGHLRPGTYDIISHRYDQMGDISNGTAPPQQEDKIEIFKFSQKQNKQVDTLLEDSGFSNFKADDLLNYIREATIGREYGKFVFTRSVSDMLELIASFAEKNGLSRDEISHVPLNSILEAAKSSGESSIEEYLRDISALEKEKHQISVAIRLPQLLTDQAGVYIVPFQVSHPNFITHKKVTAQCLLLCSEIDKLSLKNRVIIIEGADPGFDWIFSQKIAGLITKYGGANSHMAIRCAEFGIPAAIGCGEQRFDLLLKSNKVHLDCAAGLITPLH
jgi:phosphohistidine swiveling domain-containing protein